MIPTSSWEPFVLGSSLAAAIAALGAVTISGALAGGGLSAFLFARGGEPALASFAALVVLGTAVTHVGRRRKQRLGVLQADGGRRSCRHALANAGSGALALSFGTSDPWLAAACAGMLGSLGDTISSELGMLSPETPRRLLFLGPAACGDDGAMTVLGTSMGALAAAIAGGSFYMLGFGTPFAISLGIGVFLTSIVDSLLGATIEPRLPPSFANEAVNFLASSSGALTAFLGMQIAA